MRDTGLRGSWIRLPWFQPLRLGNVWQGWQTYMKAFRGHCVMMKPKLGWSDGDLKMLNMQEPRDTCQGGPHTEVQVALDRDHTARSTYVGGGVTSAL